MVQQSDGDSSHSSAKYANEWGTLYNRVGVVKRHVDRRKVLTFPSWKVLVLLLVLLFAHATTARF